VYVQRQARARRVCPNLDEEAAKPRFWAIPLPQVRSKGGIWEEKVLTDPCLQRRLTLRRDESRRGQPISEIAVMLFALPDRISIDWGLSNSDALR